MLGHFFTTALRAFYKRSKGSGAGILFAYVNVFGLTLGLAAFLVIMHVVVFELSFDNFFANSKDTYRIAVKKTESGNMVMESARSYPGLATILANEIPAVENTARLYKEECMLHYREGDVKFNRQHTFWTDRSFISIFNLEFVRTGDLTQLDRPWGAIISESAALRFFGNDWDGKNDPIGKTIWLNENLGFTIQGVYRDLPPNSHMKVDFVVSWSTLVTLAGPIFENSLPPDWNASYLYVKLSSGTSPDEVETLAAQVLKNRIPELVTRDVAYEFYLQPVRSIHLGSDIADELQPNGSKTFVASMAVAALLVLVISWINFVNLLAVRSMERAREVGVRKAIGSTRAQLVTQFLSEAFLSCGIAGLLAVAIVYIFGDRLRGITQIPYDVFSSDVQGIRTLFVFGVVVLLGGVIASAYPALRLSALATTSVLKGKVDDKPGGNFTRKSMIAFQFFCSVFLLTATAAIWQQVNFMRSQNLGMNPDQVIVMHSPRSMIGNGKRVQHFNNFREKLLTLRGVEVVGASACLPGNEFLVRNEHVRAQGSESGTNVTYDVAYVDEGYIPALGIKLISGRNFADQPGEQDKVIINATAARALEFDQDQAVGKMVVIGSHIRQVAGVIEDTHYEGLQKPVNPLILHYGHNYEFGFFPVKVSEENMQALVNRIGNVWEEFYPADPYDFFFLDEFFDQQYAQDKSFGKLFAMFAALGISIACLGLVGLVAYTTFQKTREIGIRKVLGAGVGNILVLLSKEFSIPVLVACVVAVPVTQYTVQQWLENFAYRFSFPWWIHLASTVAVLALAAMAIAWQTLKAAFSNPVNALKE